MKKSELKKLIREIISEQSPSNPVGGIGYGSGDTPVQFAFDDGVPPIVSGVNDGFAIASLGSVPSVTLKCPEGYSFISGAPPAMTTGPSAGDIDNVSLTVNSGADPIDMGFNTSGQYLRVSACMPLTSQIERPKREPSNNPLANTSPVRPTPMGSTTPVKGIQPAIPGTIDESKKRRK